MRTWQRINDQLRDHYLQVIANNAAKKSESVGVA
jgi:predicted DNA binding CopG/RHH family protein